MLIYIDTDSGVWGVGEKNLVMIDATTEEIDAIGEMSDSEIIQYGIDNRWRQW